MLQLDDAFDEDTSRDTGPAIGIQVRVKLQDLYQRRLRMSGFRYRARELREKRRIYLQDFEEQTNSILGPSSFRPNFIEEYSRGWKQLQASRTQFQEFDRAYDALEDALLQEEWELKEAETAFYSAVSDLLKDPALTRGHTLGGRQRGRDETVDSNRYHDEVREIPAHSISHQLSVLRSKRVSIIAELETLA